MAFAKFFIGDLRQIIHDPSTFASLKLHSVRIQEADAYDGAYTDIDTVKISVDTQSVFTKNASDDYTHKWYRLAFIGDPAELPVTTYFTTDPVVPEEISEVVDSVRQWLGDTDLDQPAWVDQEYIQAIRFALKQYKGEKNASAIHEEDIIPIQLLVREHFVNVIAYDHAKYYALEAPNVKLDKSQIMSHYLLVADGLRKQYEAYEKRLNMGSGGYNDQNIITQMPAVNVIEARRMSRTSGRIVTSRQPFTSKRQPFFRSIRDQNG